MGAMARQVLQVKRMNSTNCNPPEARLTVVGSVACRSGPREVATGSAVASTAAGWVAGSSVAAEAVSVEGRVAAAGGLAGVPAGAQAARKTASRIRLVLRSPRRGSVVEGLGKRRIFAI